MKKNQINLLSFQPSVSIKRISQSFLSIIKDKISGLFLRSSLFLFNNRELIIIYESEDITRRKKGEYSYIHTYIPINKITKIKIEDNEDFINIRNLKISAGLNNFVFAFDSNTNVEIIKKNIEEKLQDSPLLNK